MVLDLPCVTCLLYVYGQFIKAAWFCLVLIVDEMEESPVMSQGQQSKWRAESGNWHVASLRKVKIFLMICFAILNLENRNSPLHFLAFKQAI